MDACDDKAVWNAWYPLGAPPEIRRRGMCRTWLLDREIELDIHRTWISVASDGRPLPVCERLGYIWTTLGEPEGPPQTLIEYYEVDRLAMNIWSTPLKCSGLRLVDNVVDNAHFPFVHPGILGDEAHLELPPCEHEIDAAGALWSLSHKAWLPITGDIAEYTYRISDPYSVVLLIHRPREPGVPQRYDYLGIFAQPVTEETFIAHKMFSWVREDWMDTRQLRSDQQWISVQDKYVLERHTPKKLPLDDGSEISVPVDAASAAYREWLLSKDVRYGALRGGRR